MHIHISASKSAIYSVTMETTHILTSEDAVAWKDECPKGSICQPTVGYTPNVVDINLRPTDI